MLQIFLYYFLLFIVYAFLGWIIEVIVFFRKSKKFINRGFLIGPYCPIYGVCAVLMVLTFGRYVSTPIAMFVMAGVVCTIFEYLTSVIMEKLFNARWWDYSNEPFNVNGRVCLHNSIAFGLLGVLLLYYVNPFIENTLHSIPQVILIIFSCLLLFIFIADIITSFNVISRVKDTTNSILKDNTEEITEKVIEKVTEKVKDILSKRSILTKRLVEAFPDLKAIWVKQKEKIKEQISRK